MKKILFGLSATLLTFFASTEACTGLKLETKDGSVVHGRTLEFGVVVDTSVAFIPRGHAFTATTPDGNGMTYTSKYAALGAIAYNTIGLMDGINEEGLAIGMFYFPGYAGYTPTTKENISKSLSSIDFSNWILTQFRSVDEVKKGIKDVVIAPTIYKSWGSTPAPFHYIVYEKSGASIVIEPIDGKLVVYDNPLGVFTNSPTFDWHMTNLNNYINLSPNNAPPIKFDGLTFSSFGQGSGMVGLPGDFTPPSRFVRAAFFSRTATPVENANEGIAQTFHLLNQFDIPVGIARQVEGGVTYTDYTLVTVARDPTNLKYYFKTYEDQNVRMVDMNNFDKEGKEILTISTVGKPTYTDISKELKPFQQK